jgi:hypothetical protein
MWISRNNVCLSDPSQQRLSVILICITTNKQVSSETQIIKWTCEKREKLQSRYATHCVCVDALHNETKHITTSVCSLNNFVKQFVNLSSLRGNLTFDDFRDDFNQPTFHCDNFHDWKRDWKRYDFNRSSSTVIWMSHFRLRPSRKLKIVKIRISPTSNCWLNIFSTLSKQRITLRNAFSLVVIGELSARPRRSRAARA